MAHHSHQWPQNQQQQAEDDGLALSRTDEVLLALNRFHVAGEAGSPQPALPQYRRTISSRPSSRRQSQQSFDVEAGAPSRVWPSGPGRFTAGNIFHTLQQVAEDVAEKLKDDPLSAAPGAAHNPEDATIRIVLGEQAPQLDTTQRRKLRRTTDSFRRKLFGQASSDEADQIIQEYTTNNVRVHPLSHFRNYWDIALIALVAWTVVVLPIRAAFAPDYYSALEKHHNLFQQLEVDWMLSIDLLTDIFFLADVVLNFNTGYIRDQVLVMERRPVAVHYLKTWFLLDFVSSFPLDLVLAGRRMDRWRLPKLLKVMRVLHMNALSKTVHDLRKIRIISNIDQFHAQIAKLLAYVFIFVHWNACLQYGSCTAQGPRSHCWVYFYDLADMRVFEKYSWSALKALSEMVTAGYGVQDPVTVTDVWVSSVSLLLGTTIWLILGSIITTLLIHLNAAHSEYTARMTELNQYMKHRQLPQELRQRIRDAYEARWKAEQHFDEDEILMELPGSLRTEVCLHICEDLLACVPFFEDAEQGFVTSLVTQLRPTVYLKNDYVVREGEMAREMYFIKAGAVQVELNGLPVTVLKKGSYFGEIALLRNVRRTASVRALSETCDLFVLTKENFDEVMQQYPDSSRSMDLVAEHRLRVLRGSEASKAVRKQQSLAPLSERFSDKVQQALQDHLEPDEDEAAQGTVSSPSPALPLPLRMPSDEAPAPPRLRLERPSPTPATPSGARGSPGAGSKRRTGAIGAYRATPLAAGGTRLNLASPNSSRQVLGRRVPMRKSGVSWQAHAGGDGRSPSFTAPRRHSDGEGEEGEDPQLGALQRQHSSAAALLHVRRASADVAAEPPPGSAALQQGLQQGLQQEPALLQFSDDEAEEPQDSADMPLMGRGAENSSGRLQGRPRPADRHSTDPAD